MAIEVDTKDCTALGDVELAEMADLCADGPSRYEAGMLSKQAEAWVLITLVRENGKLKGFSFSTLERIGGTPSVIIGLAAVKRTAKRDTVLRALMTDELRREGVARELIRAIQDARKAAGLEISDRIQLGVEAGPVVTDALIEHRDTVAVETLAVDVIHGEVEGPAVATAIEGGPVRITVRRADYASPARA